jgi:hypothetical protein
MIKEFQSKIDYIRSKDTAFDLSDRPLLIHLQYDLLWYMTEKKREVWLIELTIDEYFSKRYKSLREEKRDRRMTEEMITNQIKEEQITIKKTLIEAKKEIDTCHRINKFIESTLFLMYHVFKAEQKNFTNQISF